MEMRVLGSTGWQVSRYCLGTMTFGKQVDAASAAAMIDLSLEQGINFVDTANVYNAGMSEEIVGEILESRRDQIVLATKAGIKVGEGPDESGLSPLAIRSQLEKSLRRLKTDYVDLFYLHVPDPATPLEESLATCDALVREGKVRQLGVSNFAAWQITHMHAIASAAGYQAVAVTQSMYNPLARRMESELVPACKRFNVGITIYNPLAGGLLTGKHSSDQPPTAGTRFDNNTAYQDRYWRAENFEAVERLSAAAREEGRSLISLVFAWLRQSDCVDSIILGASSMSQLKENLAAANDPPCSPESLTIIDDVWRRLHGAAPAYHR